MGSYEIRLSPVVSRKINHEGAFISLYSIVTVTKTAHKGTLLENHQFSEFAGLSIHKEAEGRKRLLAPSGTTLADS